MLEDVQRWQLCKLFQFQVMPWDLDAVPEYWLNRAILFENAINEADAHRASRPN